MTPIYYTASRLAGNVTSPQWRLQRAPASRESLNLAGVSPYIDCMCFLVLTQQTLCCKLSVLNRLGLFSANSMPRIHI